MNATGQQPSGLPCATPAATAAVAAGPSPGCRDADIPLPCGVDRQIKHSKSQIPRLVRPAVQGQDERPRPGRRRRQQLQREANSSPSPSTPRPRMQRLRNVRLSPLYFSTLMLVLALCSCCRPVAATITASEITIDAAMSSALASLEREGRILVDTRPPPNVAELRKRQDEGTTTMDSSTSSSTIEPSSTTTANSSSTSTSLSPTSIPTDSGTPNSDSLPTPFDSGVGTNFTTSSCPNFLTSFLSSAAFKSCLPFSLLLQVSF